MPAELLVVAIPLLAAFLVVSFREPVRIALPLYAALIPFGSALSIGSSVFGSVSSLLGMALGLALLLQLVTLRRSARRIPPDLPVWLAFLGVTGATVFWSVAPELTRDGFLVLGSQILLYVLVVLAGISRAELARTEHALIIGGVLAALFGVTQLLFLGGLPTGEGASPRFGEGLLGPNNQAAAFLLPTAIALARVASEQGRRRWRFAGATTVLLIGVVLTGSRGGLLATILVLLTMVLVTRRGRSALIAYFVAGSLLLATILVVNPAGVGQRQVSAGQNSSGRSDIWAVGFSACRTYCLTGSGWGTFPRVYAAERASVPDARVIKRGVYFEPHSIWLLASVEAGLLGLLLLVVGLGLSLATALRLPAHLRGPPLAALLGTVFAGFFLSNLEFKFFWMALIYVALCYQVAQAEGSVATTGRRLSTARR